jgi:hypothetical protein
LLEIVEADDTAGFCLRLVQCGQDQPEENGDDGDRDQQLDEAEAATD